jgi:hypothetical protein
MKKIFLLAVAALLPLTALAAPSLILTPSHGTAGQNFTVSGSGFSASTNVLVSMQGQPQTSGVGVSNGSFSTTLTVPNTSSGNYTVLATSPQREQGSAIFTVDQAAASPLVYPRAQPSSWYTLPGQTMYFSGSRFLPGDTVRILGGGGEIDTTVGADGSFVSPSFTVPFKWQRSTQTFSVESPHSAYPIKITVHIGTFYPKLSPSTYYVAAGQTMSATARGFAPGEPVMLLANGALVQQLPADAQGSVSFNFMIPNRGRITLMAQGAYSEVSSSRTITAY